MYFYVLCVAWTIFFATSILIVPMIVFGPLACIIAQISERHFRLGHYDLIDRFNEINKVSGDALWRTS